MCDDRSAHSDCLQRAGANAMAPGILTENHIQMHLQARTKQGIYEELLDLLLTLGDIIDR